MSVGSPAFYVVRPLTATARSRMKGRGTEISPFRASWANTEDLLIRELRALGGRDAVLMVDVAETEIRLDGRLRAAAHASTPGVAFAFNARSKGPMLFCCARFRHWQDNTRGIALGLEALRKVERYGIAQSDEQYEGWRQIAAGDVFKAATDPYVRAWSVIADACGLSLDAARADPKASYRMARKATHPDQGGSAAAFRAVEEAARIIGL